MENFEGLLYTLEGEEDEELQIMEKFRKQRRLEIEQKVLQHREWLLKGHGKYTEIEEKEFFIASKSSPDMVVHFYEGDSAKCEVFDHHLEIIAAAHLEARFVKINAMKSPILAERFKIRVIPTLLIVKNGKCKDYVVGLRDFGNFDNFSTADLKRRLEFSGVIKCDISDLLYENLRNKGIRRLEKKTIREISSSRDSSD